MLKPLSLSQLTTALNGRVLTADASFTAVSTDSRSVAAGELFVALVGPRFDGHAYLNEVASKGAVAALVEREVADCSLPQLLVADTRLALGQLGALNRAAFAQPVAAVTGSSGKTTIKEMLAAILSQGLAGPVLATRGNLNNDLGAPLTLLELAPGHVAAVIELGANHVGEIAYTVGLTRPQVAIISNAGNAHVGEFGGPEKIVEAKGEILDGIVEGGVAILNRDDQAFTRWAERAAPRNVVSFAVANEQADFHASAISQDVRGCVGFTLHSPLGEARIQLNLLGAHNVANAVAAIAAAAQMGVGLPAMVQALEQLQPIKGRCVAQMSPRGVRVIDDSYNANPLSMKAAVDILQGFSGRRLLVLGDMGELGEWAEEGHREVGAYAAGKVDALLAVGPLMKHAVEAFGPGARHFDDQASLLAALTDETGDVTILIKGSRSAAMEKIAVALCTTGEVH